METGEQYGQAEQSELRERATCSFCRDVDLQSRACGHYITEESYTSKCSFLDHEPICKHESYAGRRIKRGLFRSQFGSLINANVNGSLNIIRKVAPKAFEGVEGIAVCPEPLAVGA